MTEWHYVAQRARTGEILSHEVPLRTDGPAWTLSGAGSLSGTLSPDVGLQRAADGRLILEEWGTLVYAVANDEIRWGGIVISSSFEGDTWNVEAAGFATYPHGLHYDNAKTWTQASPVEPFRELWANAQWRPNARLGVFVVAEEVPTRVGYRGTAGDNSPISPGDITDDKWAELVLDGWTVVDGRLNPPARVFRANVSAEQYKHLVDDLDWREEEKPDGAPDGWTSTYADPPLVKIQAAPYELAWWETPDIGQKIDELTSTSGFDWVERHLWVPNEPVVDAELADDDLVEWLKANGWYGKPDDGAELLYRPTGRPEADEIAHIIKISFPRVGRRRTDLTFVQGDNVLSVVSPAFDGDEYANSVTALGAGEGIAALRQEAAVDDGRLYRAAVYTDKASTDLGTLSRKASAELARRLNALDITEITVRNHPNAPLNSWSLGDDILVEATIPWLGDIALWCRITAWAMVGDDRAKLTLSRSDSFTYGG